MSCKVTKKSEHEPEVVQCKNCRQDILRDKMFLHEGFCARNNIYCDHCEKVFLKKDYEYHVKLIKKDNSQKDNDSSAHSQKSKDTQSETFKPSSFTEDVENTSNNVITIVPKPSLEIVQMPVTEMYKINAPIYVSETGEVVSKENKNEYLLPLLGINFRSSKINEKILNDIIEKGDIFKENQNFNQNNDDFQDIKNILNNNDIFSKNNTINANTHKSIKHSNFSVKSMTLKANKTMKNNFNLVIHEINNTNDPAYQKYSNTLNTIEEKNKENIKPNDSVKKNNNNLPNKLTTKHSQRLLNRKYNYYTLQQTPQKNPMNNLINKSIRRSKKIIMPQDSNNKNKNLNEKITKLDKYKSYTKEPQDSSSKIDRDRNSFKFNKQSGDKKNVSSLYESFNNNLTVDYDITRCEYCKNLFTPSKFSDHYQNCKLKKKNIFKKFDIPKPKKKKEKIKEKDEFICEEDEETGINKKNRETLTRKFNASLNVISLNCDKRFYSGYFTNNQTQFKKEPQKITLKKKLFHNITYGKKDKKSFPEDSNREEIPNNRNSKLFNRINNSISIDGNNSINYNLKINGHRSPEITSFKRSIPSGRIYPLVYFNNDKVVFLHPKDKNSLRNSKV